MRPKDILTLPRRAIRIYKIAPSILHMLEMVPDSVWANGVEFSGMDEGVRMATDIIYELRSLLYPSRTAYEDF